ncbi:MAG: hypothetical protein P0S94_01705, partial [Simkaniaceae bacterium]|nr:hypothetical protein [Simkaniaceae bacterium]
MFTFPDRWEVSVDDGILDSRLIFDENEYVGMYTLHKESFSRDDYEEALVSCDKTEEIEKIVRGKFSDI